MPDAKPREYPFHCLLKYFKNATQLNDEDWLSCQSKQVQLSLSCIVLAPRGAAMKIDMNEYLNIKYNIKKSVPHVT